MLRFLPNSQAPKNSKERDRIEALDKQRLDSWQENFKMEAAQIREIPTIPQIVPTNVFPISQKFSKYSALNYGKIGNVAGAGCGPLAVEYALRILGYPCTFEEILNECVQKGYRAYIFDTLGNIINGAGTEQALFDNNAITLKGVYDLVEHLKERHPITLLVNNAIYHNDAKRKGNHFVTLVGFDEDGNLMIMDGNLITDEKEPSAALVKRSFSKMIDGIRCAWAWKI